MEVAAPSPREEGVSLRDLSVHGVFDAELVGFVDGVPHFPLACERLLDGERSLPLTFVLFDFLELEGKTVMRLPYADRRGVLRGHALQRVRRRRIRAAGGRCEHCGRSDGPLELHHLGQLDDYGSTLVLCERCHRQEHRRA